MDKLEAKYQLLHDDEFLKQYLLELYKLQTVGERDSRLTSNKNKVGFNKVDAVFLSSCAQFLQTRGFLTNKQLQLVRKKMIKYSGQIANIVNQRESATFANIVIGDVK